MFAMFVRIMGGCIMQNFQRRLFFTKNIHKPVLKNDKHWNLYVDQIELLIDKYEKVDVKTMGFPDDWKKLLEQK